MFVSWSFKKLFVRPNIYASFTEEVVSMLIRRSFLCPLALVIMLAMASYAQSSEIGYWRMEGTPGGSAAGVGTIVDSGPNNLVGDGYRGLYNGVLAYSADVPDVWIYDPVSGGSHANQSSMEFNANEESPGAVRSSDYISIPDNAVMHSNDLTIELFYKRDLRTYRSALFIGKNTAYSATVGFGVSPKYITPSPAGFELHWSRPGEESNMYRVQEVGTVVPSALEGWHHFALSFDHQTATAKFYLDYNLKNTYTLPDYAGLAWNTNDLLIGNNVDAWIDEVRWTNAVLSPDQFLRAVPEPTSLSLIALGGVLLLKRKSR